MDAQHVRIDHPVGRLSPEMASFRLLVLEFVRAYIARWNASPSLGEVAAALTSNRTRVRKAVRSLEEEGLLLRRPGARGLALPSQEAAALGLLRRLGWHVDEPRQAARRRRHSGVTNRPLRELPVLDYLPLHGQTQEKARREEADPT